ncbi:MAG: aspartate aminotransferase family protein [Spirochaetaceae bacterium]|nr:MAG: aspartate aminotransferase family protein [Spirochaetaceae bacterium]
MKKVGSQNKETQAILDCYFKRTTKSRELNSEATRSLPGGDTRQSVYFYPYPTYMVRGEGCYIFDQDGNQYIDYMNNYTSLFHGHNHRKIREVVTKQLTCGTVFGAPHKSQFELADIICERVPSIENIRFCNSGTEATMLAIRAARAYTGKDKIIKMEGGYHGTHDVAEASVSPSLEEAGDAESPNVVPYSRGIPENTFENVVIVPFNNVQATKSAIHAHRDELAAIIVEPVMNAAGTIPATKEYLRFLRDITKKEGILLIFDEVATLRMSFGGAQQYYEITPDLTTLGKIIGGGLPVGAFGGREDIMSMFSPKEGTLHHAGTFNGHPLAMVAGIVAMQESTIEVYKQVNALGDSLRKGINDVFADIGIAGSTSGMGSLLTIHYTTNEIKDYRDSKRAQDGSGQLPTFMHLCLLNHGIFMASRGQLALSTPMREDEIRGAVNAIREACVTLKPYIHQFLPHLIK